MINNVVLHYTMIRNTTIQRIVVNCMQAPCSSHIVTNNNTLRHIVMNTVTLRYIVIINSTLHHIVAIITTLRHIVTINTTLHYAVTSTIYLRYIVTSDMIIHYIVSNYLPCAIFISSPIRFIVRLCVSSCLRKLLGQLPRNFTGLDSTLKRHIR